MNYVPEIEEGETPNFLRLVKSAAMAPNAQTGCERANLQYNLAKTSLSSTMGIPMIQARLRIKINGPPLSMFNAADVRKEWNQWIKKGHQYAESITKKKLVLQRIRKEAKEYTSKIFT